MLKHRFVLERVKSEEDLNERECISVGRGVLSMNARGESMLLARCGIPLLPSSCLRIRFIEPNVQEAYLKAYQAVVQDTRHTLYPYGVIKQSTIQGLSKVGIMSASNGQLMLYILEPVSPKESTMDKEGKYINTTINLLVNSISDFRPPWEELWKTTDQLLTTTK